MTHVLLANKHYLGPAGGAERNISDLANWLADQGYRVTIISETKHGDRPAFPLRAGVNVHVPRDEPESRDQPDACMLRYLAEDATMYWARTSFAMRKKWARSIDAIAPDLIITYMPHTSTPLLQELGTRYPILVTNQNDPAIDYFSDKHGDDPIDKRIRLESLEFAAAVHFLIPPFVDKMPANVRQKSVVIPNVVPPHAQLSVDHRQERKVIIGVGRLVPQKGFDLLIEAFAQSQSRHSGWELHIFGDGPEKGKLHDIIRRRRLQRSVFLRGFTSTVTQHLDQADIFAIPSKYEGWGLSLTEAMSAGLPCIGLEDCSGVNWLIKHGRTGLLAQRSASDLARQIDLLANDPGLRRHLGVAATEAVRAFAPDRVYEIWRDVIDGIARGRHDEWYHRRNSSLQRA